MKITVGTDIIEVERIKKAFENTAFAETVFTENEITYCESKNNSKYEHYAARFAAKEATFKAISQQIEDKFDISWKDIEITNNKQGRPMINICSNKINMSNIINIDLSISHCKEYAVANVSLLIN